MNASPENFVPFINGLGDDRTYLWKPLPLSWLYMICARGEGGGGGDLGGERNLREIREIPKASVRKCSGALILIPELERPSGFLPRRSSALF